MTVASASVAFVASAFVFVALSSFAAFLVASVD
jgi:hypothetical protein